MRTFRLAVEAKVFVTTNVEIEADNINDAIDKFEPEMIDETSFGERVYYQILKCPLKEHEWEIVDHEEVEQSE
jgi:hypothetical protein